MRPAKRWLPGNKGTEGPSSLLFFDSESHSERNANDPDIQRLSLRLWCAISLRLEGGRVTRAYRHRGHTAAQFHELVRRLSSPHRCLWGFAHNLGFDLTMLDFWDALDRGIYTIGPVDRGVSRRTGKPLKPWTGRLCLEARPTFCVVRNDIGKIRFVDTGNYWPTKLTSVGESYGVPKMAMPEFSDNDEAWFEYCENDCRVIEVAVTRLLKSWVDEKCGVFRMTAPGLAFQHFRHTCHHRAKKGESVGILLEDNSPARPLERDGYYGGRIEPFFVGVHPGPIYHLDCNSLYPHVMRANLFPVRRVESFTAPDPQRLKRLMVGYGAVARVRVRSVTDTHISRRGGVQYHTTGCFWTTLVGPELFRALAAGQVLEVSEAHTYVMADLFSQWVQYWYDRKVKAKEAGPSQAGQLEFINLILKSLSGKFGQLAEYWIDRHDICPRSRWGHFLRSTGADGPCEMWRAIAGKSQCKTPGAEPSEAYPIISAYITSYAREFMRSILKSLPHHSYLYMATDSLVLTRAGYDSLMADGRVHPTRLGGFKELGVFDECEIRGPNYYRLDDQWCRSGLYGKARFEGPRGFVTDVWQQLPTILGQQPDGSVTVRTTLLQPSVPTAKGVVGPDGWVTTAFVTDHSEFDFSWPRRPGSEPDRPRAM